MSNVCYTIRVYATATGRNVGGQCEIWNPQILYVYVAKCVDYCFVKTFSGEHRCYGIC